jgi:hypothetical protein
LSLRAYCCLALGAPADAVDLLDDEDERVMQPEPLLAKAYILKGEPDRAVALLQRFIFHSVIGAFAAVPDLMTLYAGDPEKLEAWLRLALETGDAVGLRQTQPHHYFALYATAALLFLSAGKTDRALDLLETYADLATDRTLFPMRLRGSDLFDRLEAFYAALNIGVNVPRSEKLIKKDLKQIVTDNPAFAPLAENERFRRLAERLAQLDS